VADYHCEKCKKKRVSVIKRKILKLPEVFIFQLQRFAVYPRLRKIRGQI
jgi:ubiquitin C-terminal hydrolase